MHIDLNSDLGEGFGNWDFGDDAAMLEVVTSANIACGFHAGDPRHLLQTCRQAADRGVRIGAQVGYRDLAGFGRRFIDVEPADLIADVRYQIGALDGLARSVGSCVSYVKPHGALYNTVVSHTEQAAAVVEAVRGYDRELGVLGLPGSDLLALSEAAGLRVYTEAFADRAYTPQGELRSRRLPGAVITDLAVIAARIRRLVTAGEIICDDGSVIPMAADSICVHGDTPGAVEMSAAVRDVLDGVGVEVRSFTEQADSP